MKTVECAGVIFFDEEKVLLEDRSLRSKHGEKYSFYGGKIEANETPLIAAKREIHEELGIHLTSISFFEKFEFTISADLHLVYHMFVAKMPDMSVLVSQEGFSPRVISLKDIDSIELLPQDRIVIKSFMKKYL